MIEKVNDINLVLPFIKKYFPNYTVENSPYEKMFCYKEGDNIIGFISYSMIYERAELNYIVTDEQYRRKGIGQKLLDYAIEDLKNNMVENFSLEVNVNNKVAIKFYLKNKFEIKATRHNYYVDGDAYLMVREVR